MSQRRIFLGIFLCGLLIGFRAQVWGQNMERVRSSIDTLCSRDFFGRGYVQDGERKAAEWLRRQFAQAGLKSLGEDYFQSFALNVNTFPGQVAVQVGKRVLVPGEDFLPDPLSGRGLGKLKPVWLDTAVFTDTLAAQAFARQSLAGKALVYDAKWEANILQMPEYFIKRFVSTPLAVVLHERLLMSVGRQQYQFPKIHLLKNQIGPKDKKLRFNIEAVYRNGYPTQNVLGWVPGTVKPDSFLVITAHYDHLGGFGDHTYFPGGNDNASGVALLLELAYSIGQQPLPYSVLFMATGAEEAGLIGSTVYVENPLFPLDKIRFLLNIDLAATGEKGLMAVNGVEEAQNFQLLDSLNTAGGYLPSIGKRRNAPNSDHFPFTQQGVPAFFIYLMGDWPHYHHIADKPPLPLTRFEATFQLFDQFLKAIGQEGK